ncbi:MAG: inositol monophosphatase [Proteobacteria bacterium]|nr:inositol monophosphatase [Pseudomonadota bacterium]
MAHTSAIINVMVAAARKAARKLIRDFGEVENLQVSKKGPADFVSAADRRAEEVIQAELVRARPDFGFLMEARVEIKGRDGANRWVVDPLDGTTNFLHSIPHFSISIAHQSGNEILAGVVYEPLRDEMFTAEKGAGAFVNGGRIRVSARQNIAEAVLGTGIPFKGQPGHAEFLSRLEAVTERVAGVRHLGSAALDLAYVAAGRFEGYWESGVNPWNVAAGLLLVREAGGLVGALTKDGDPLTAGDILASNPYLYEAMKDLLETDEVRV